MRALCEIKVHNCLLLTFDQKRKHFIEKYAHQQWITKEEEKTRSAIPHSKKHPNNVPTIICIHLSSRLFMHNNDCHSGMTSADIFLSFDSLISS